MKHGPKREPSWRSVARDQDENGQVQTDEAVPRASGTLSQEARKARAPTPSSNAAAIPIWASDPASRRRGNKGTCGDAGVES